MNLMNMSVRNYSATDCTPELNASIVRAVQKLAHDLGDFMVSDASRHPWGCCVEFWDREADKPYYHVLVQASSIAAACSEAEYQMGTLRQFPLLPMTGTLTTEGVISALRAREFDSVIDRFPKNLTGNYESLPIELRDDLRSIHYITNSIGGIRVPYKATVTNSASKGIVLTERGEIRVTSSGATEEWQDLFFTFQIFGQIQKILSRLWKEDAIVYDLSKLHENNSAHFWLTTLNIQEA